MNKFIGVKEINAKPMTRQEYNDFRGWELPENEQSMGDDNGYLVEYIDGGTANTEGCSNYVSWSPKDIFDRAYRPVSGLNFGLAIEAMKKGKRVARSGWNGKGINIFIVDEAVGFKRVGFSGENCDVNLQEHIVIDTNGLITDNANAPKSIIPWLASQSDMMADDWMIIE